MNLRRILFPTELSGDTNAAWPVVALLAEAASAEVVVLYVAQSASQTNSPADAELPESASEKNKERLEQFAHNEHRFRIERHSISGDPAPSIIQFAQQQQIDLIVMATHGCSEGTELRIGRVTEKVIHTAPCPVLMFKTPGTGRSRNGRQDRVPVQERGSRTAEQDADGMEKLLCGKLANLESQLEETIVPGGLSAWAGAVHDTLSEVAPVLHDTIESKHKPIFSEIKEVDHELIRRVQQMKEDDVEILQKLDSLREDVESFLSRSSQQSVDEQLLKQDASTLLKEGMGLIVQVRVQEKAVTTWLQEAFNRDRGVAD